MSAASGAAKLPHLRTDGAPMQLPHDAVIVVDLPVSHAAQREEPMLFGPSPKWKVPLVEKRLVATPLDGLAED